MNPTDRTPVAIEREGEANIVIRWDDGHEDHWTTRELRDACPCATCKEKHGKSKPSDKPAAPAGLPILSAAQARPLRIEAMKPVGSYAYQIQFSDGHSSGIYPFALLRKD